MRKILIHDRTFLRSPALSQVYLSLTFQLSQTVVVTSEMNSTFWTIPVKLNVTAVQSLHPEETEQLITMLVKLAMLQSKCSVYQDCLEQSQKHVWNGAYDHFNYMETRLYLRCNKLQLSNSHMVVL